jgi:hypothetical protein
MSLLENREHPTLASRTCACAIRGHCVGVAGLVFVAGSAANNRKIMWADARNCANGWRSATRFQGVPILAFANNHYAGNGPATVREFGALWKAQHPPKAKAKHAENLRLF